MPSLTKTKDNEAPSSELVLFTATTAAKQDWLIQACSKVNEVGVIGLGICFGVGTAATPALSIASFAENPLYGLGALATGTMAVWGRKLMLLSYGANDKYAEERETDGSAEQAVKRRSIKRGHKLEKVYGWRPRQGMPHPKGRDDTYDRQIVHVEPAGSGYMVSLQRWEHSTTAKHWTQRNTIEQQIVNSDEAMTQLHHQWTEKAKEFNQQNKKRWFEATYPQLVEPTSQQLLADRMNTSTILEQ